MSIAKIQTGDQVKVISGKYRGTVGLVSKVINKTLPNGTPRTRVAVSEIPQIVDYRRNLRAYNMPGEMKTKERMLDVSNVQLVTADGKVSRTKVEVKDGKKVRVFKKTGKAVVKQAIAPKAVEAKEVKETKEEKPKKETKTTKKTTTKAKK